MRFSHKHGSFTINGNGRVFPGFVCFRPLLQLSLIDCVCFSNFAADIIEKIIVSLNPNKAHGHDNISICMLKICGDAICKHLEKKQKAALSLVTKKTINETLQITVQFLYFLSAEKYLMKCLLGFFLANNLLAPNQSGFKPGGSCIINFYELLMRFIHLLMMGLKLEVFSWIYLKPLIKLGMKGLYLNFSKTVFRLTS